MTWSLQLTIWALPPLLAVLVVLRDLEYLWPRRREAGASALMAVLFSAGAVGAARARLRHQLVLRVEDAAGARAVRAGRPGSGRVDGVRDHLHRRPQAHELAAPPAVRPLLDDGGRRGPGGTFGAAGARGRARRPGQRVRPGRRARSMALGPRRPARRGRGRVRAHPIRPPGRPPRPRRDPMGRAGVGAGGRPRDRVAPAHPGGGLGQSDPHRLRAGGQRAGLSASCAAACWTSGPSRARW